MLIPNLFYE